MELGTSSKTGEGVEVIQGSKRIEEEVKTDRTASPTLITLTSLHAHIIGWQRHGCHGRIRGQGYMVQAAVVGVGSHGRHLARVGDRHYVGPYRHLAAGTSHCSV